MAAIVWADVTNHAAELATVGLAAQNDVLAFVNTALKVSEFSGGEASPKLKLARIYLAAHVATLTVASGGSAPSGALIAETVDNISRAFAAGSSGGDHNWNATSYGGQFRSMIRTSPARLPRVF